MNSAWAPLLAIFLVFITTSVAANPTGLILVDDGETVEWHEVELGSPRSADSLHTSLGLSPDLKPMNWSTSEEEWTVEEGAWLVPGGALAFVASESEIPLPNPISPAPWSSFRGPFSNGSSTSPGPWDLEPAWWRDLGDGFIDAAPLAHGGRIFVLTAGAYDFSAAAFSDPPTLHALSAVDGSTIWSRDISGKSYQLATPVLDDRNIYLTTSSGDLIALDQDTGTPLWETETGSGIDTSLVLSAGLLTYGSEDGIVRSHWSSNGTVAWEYGPIEGQNASFYFAQGTIDRGLLYLGAENGILYAFDHDTGILRWSSFIGDRIRSSVLVHDDTIYLTTSEHTSSALVSTGGHLVALDMNGHQTWRRMVGPSPGSPSAFGSQIIVGSLEGLRVFSPGGEEISRPLERPVLAPVLISSDGVVYASLWSDHAIWSWNPTTNQTSEISLDPPSYLLSPPVVTDCTIIQTSDNGFVYRLAARDGCNDPLYRSTAPPAPTFEEPVSSGTVVLIVGLLLLAIIGAFMLVQNRKTDIVPVVSTAGLRSTRLSARRLTVLLSLILFTGLAIRWSYTTVVESPTEQSGLATLVIDFSGSSPGIENLHNGMLVQEDLRLEGETSVFDLLEQVARGDFAIDASWYPTYQAHYVHGIAGVTEDPALGRYWTFTVNDEPSALGADRTYPSDGDQVTWTYGTGS